MIVMHFGIGLAMSAQVGLLFLTTLPSYLVGFDCRAKVGSLPWCLAGCIGLGPSLASVCGWPMGECWPFTPVSLFRWSGPQALALSRALMVGDTRVGMSTDAAAHVLQMPVVPPGVPANICAQLCESAPGGVVLHDVLTRAIGFTLAQGDLADGALAIRQNSQGCWDVSQFVTKLNAWLQKDRRLIEMHSGRELLQATFVKINKRGHVIEHYK